MAAAALAPSSHAVGKVSSFKLGLELPPLPYAYDALEPFVDKLTMEIHHDKHHAAYLKNLSETLEKAGIQTENVLDLIADIPSLPEAIQTAVRNNGGGHVNHSAFWKWLAPSKGENNAPSGALADLIKSTFGSFEDFKKAFGEAAAKRFGSGWAWLIVKSDGTLAVVSTPNQDNPIMKGIVPDSDLGTPILGLDVWEHAYYLKHQNKRPDYVSGWWNVVNWEFAERIFDRIRG